MKSCGIHLTAMLQEMLKISILDISLKISYLRLQLHLPEVSELKKFSWSYCMPEVHFTNDFSIVIQTRWKFHSALIQVVVKQSLWNFGCGTTTMLSWHVQNFVVIWYIKMKLHSNHFFFFFNFNMMEKSFMKWALVPGILDSERFLSVQVS